MLFAASAALLVKLGDSFVIIGVLSLGLKAAVIIIAILATAVAVGKVSKGIS